MHATHLKFIRAGHQSLGPPPVHKGLLLSRVFLAFAHRLGSARILDLIGEEGAHRAVVDATAVALRFGVPPPSPGFRV